LARPCRNGIVAELRALCFSVCVPSLAIWLLIWTVCYRSALVVGAEYVYAGTGFISHYVKPPSKAALLLIAKHGAAKARKHALRELRNARRARSRMRFTLWATVVAEIDALRRERQSFLHRPAQILRWPQQTLSVRMRGFGRFAAISSTQHNGRVVKRGGNLALAELKRVNAGAVSS
jgi:hypothetical protein